MVWRKNNQPLRLPVANRLTKAADSLIILNAQAGDKGRYTCHASNEAGVLDTDFVVEVIGKI